MRPSLDASTHGSRDRSDPTSSINNRILLPLPLDHCCIATLNGQSANKDYGTNNTIPGRV